MYETFIAFLIFTSNIEAFLAGDMSQVKYILPGIYISQIHIPETPQQESIDIDITQLKTQVFVDGLTTPWELVFLDDTTALVTERSGKIKRIVDGKVQDEVYFSSDAYQIGEGGLLGMAKDPNFEKNHYLYIYSTYKNPQGLIRNKITRLIDKGDHAIVDKVILDEIPGAQYHDGGRLLFGPDGKLYVTTGDAQNPDNAQTYGNLAGKILRINTDGSIPDDNPTPGSRIYSLGHRNPQGIVFDEYGNLFASSHGPTGEFGLQKRDRVLDAIISGGNYGWPQSTDGGNIYEKPLIFSGPSVGTPPSGITYWKGRIWIAILGSAGQGQKLITTKVKKVGDTWEAYDVQNLFQDEFGRLRSLVVGPDDNLYILTSNRDGRGKAKYGSDKIIKVFINE